MTSRESCHRKCAVEGDLNMPPDFLSQPGGGGIVPMKSAVRPTTERLRGQGARAAMWTVLSRAKLWLRREAESAKAGHS